MLDETVDVDAKIAVFGSVPTIANPVDLIAFGEGSLIIGRLDWIGAFIFWIDGIIIGAVGGEGGNGSPNGDGLEAIECGFGFAPGFANFDWIFESGLRREGFIEFGTNLEILEFEDGVISGDGTATDDVIALGNIKSGNIDFDRTFAIIKEEATLEWSGDDTSGGEGGIDVFAISTLL